MMTANIIRATALSVRIASKADLKGLRGVALVEEVERLLCEKETIAQRSDRPDAWANWVDRKTPLESAIQRFKAVAA